MYHSLRYLASSILAHLHLSTLTSQFNMKNDIPKPTINIKTTRPYELDVLDVSDELDDFNDFNDFEDIDGLFNIDVVLFKLLLLDGIYYLI
jgi:hypothetical protein